MEAEAEAQARAAAAAVATAELLEKWQDALRRRIQVHYFSELYYYSVNKWLDTPIRIVTAVTGALTFSTFGIAETSDAARIIYNVTGALQIAVVTVMAIQAVLDLHGREAVHKSAHTKLTTALNAVEGVYGPKVEWNDTASLIGFISTTFDEATAADYSIPWAHLIRQGYAKPEDRFWLRPVVPVVVPPPPGGAGRGPD